MLDAIADAVQAGALLNVSYQSLKLHEVIASEGIDWEGVEWVSDRFLGCTMYTPFGLGTRYVRAVKKGHAYANAHFRAIALPELPERIKIPIG